MNGTKPKQIGFFIVSGNYHLPVVYLPRVERLLAQALISL